MKLAKVVYSVLTVCSCGLSCTAVAPYRAPLSGLNVRCAAGIVM